MVPALLVAVPKIPVRHMELNLRTLSKGFSSLQHSSRQPYSDEKTQFPSKKSVIFWFRYVGAVSEVFEQFFLNLIAQEKLRVSSKMIHVSSDNLYKNRKYDRCQKC